MVSGGAELVVVSGDAELVVVFRDELAMNEFCLHGRSRFSLAALRVLRLSSWWRRLS